MDVAVFGLGYVGVVSACCIAQDGHRVTGVDPVQAKVDAINAGLSPIVEPGVSELIGRLRREGRISATCDGRSALAGADIALLCVGTPSRANGDLDLTHIRSVAAEIGDALAQVDGYRVIAVRSTVLPGTVLGEVREALESHSGRRAGSDFGLCFNPEFLREGTAISDYRHPSKTVIGAMADDDRAVSMLKDLYAGLDAPLIVTSIPISEMVKYIDNAWHAVKVAFGNEIGTICKRAGIDSHQAMNIFVQDTKLNLSSYYLWPGFAFGGSCLPKDLRALTYRGRSADLSLPLLESVIPSNRSHIDRAFDMIATGGRKRVGVSGLSFKAGTDDLRESPVVELVERLIGKGFDVRIHDPDVRFAALVGANRSFILDHIGHVSGLMVETVDELVGHAQIIVLAKKDQHAARAAACARPDQRVIDLVRATDARGEWQYDGICW